MFVELVAAAALATASLPSASAPPPVTAANAQPAAAPARQLFSWKWTDGSRKTERVFRKSRYGSINMIPKFVIKVYPAYPPWKATLQFWVNGRWVRLDEQRSDFEGKMYLSFDPRGASGVWEDVTWIVRVRLQDISTTRKDARQAVEELMITVRYTRM